MAKLKVVGGSHDGMIYEIDLVVGGHINLPQLVTAEISPYDDSGPVIGHVVSSRYRRLIIAGLLTEEDVTFLAPANWSDETALRYLIDSHRTPNNGTPVHDGGRVR